MKDVGGEVLCGMSPSSRSPAGNPLIRPTVSQFTLLASTKKGKKPSFHRSAPEQLARDLYSSFYKKTQELYEKEKVKDGVFQAMMDVALVNDGPVGLDYRCEDEAVNLSVFYYTSAADFAIPC